MAIMQAITIYRRLSRGRKLGGRVPAFQGGGKAYLGHQGRVDVKFQNEVKTLIHIITENRNRRASGPVHSILLHICLILIFTI